MATTEERLAALEAKMAQLTDTTPTTYYTHQYSGEEIDAAVGRALTGGALDTSVTNVSNQLGTLVRPNLLDNWYFGNPVNQRGQTELASGNLSTYFIDRWVAASPVCAYAITDDSIKISKLPHQYQQIWLQKMERMEKRTYTLSFFLKDIGLLSMTFTPQGSDSTEQILDGGFIVSFTSEANLKNPVIRLLTSESVTVSEVTILAAKIELGPTQTLAHREGDRWILNEVPDYGEQLRRCQRYCRVYKAGEYLPCLAYPESDGWYLSASMYTGNMRTTPVNNLGSGLKCSVSNIDGGTSIDKYITNWGIVGSTIQRLRISDGDKTPGHFPYNVMPKQDLIFSADL